MSLENQNDSQTVIDWQSLTAVMNFLIPSPHVLNDVPSVFNCLSFAGLVALFCTGKFTWHCDCPRAFFTSLANWRSDSASTDQAGSVGRYDGCSFWLVIDKSIMKQHFDLSKLIWIQIIRKTISPANLQFRHARRHAFTLRLTRLYEPSHEWENLRYSIQT